MAVTERLIGKRQLIYIGIYDCVLALDAENGEEIWRTKLKSGGSFTGIAVMHGRIFAAAQGELFCLDPKTGEILWHNKLKGLGLGYITFADDTGAGAKQSNTAGAAAAAAASSDADAAVV